jgi:ribosomal-protein-alanine N-acetyltransferase
MVISPLHLVDRYSLIEFSHTARFSNLHLDWHDLPALLNERHLLAAVDWDGRGIGAAIGAEVITYPDGRQSAWIRLALASSPDSVRHRLPDLWNDLKSQLVAAGLTHVAWLLFEPWTVALADQWNFKPLTEVVALTRTKRDVPQADCPEGAPERAIRVAGQADLEAILRVDNLAFEPVWRNDMAMLQIATQQAAYLTVWEQAGRVQGYQLSTHHIDGIHLARLAVNPALQGQGIGAALVCDLIQYSSRQGFQTFTVNTQQDNLASRRLYARMGFVLSGYAVKVSQAALIEEAG